MAAALPSRARRRMRAFAAAALAATALAGCAAGGSAPGAGAPAPAVQPPPAGAGFDYQLGGDYPPPEGVGVVARDATAEPAEGVYSICYVNGFQTQPGADWSGERARLLLSDAEGTPVADPDWPDEFLLDTSSAGTRAAILEVIGPVVDECARKGFRAVEFDNLDSFARSGGALDAEDNLALAVAYVERAHAAGLAAGQKNAAELSARLRGTAGFDFAIAEECQHWGECAAYAEAYGALVFDIEYTDDPGGSFAAVCADPAAPVAILRDRALADPRSVGYRYERCAGTSG